MQMHLYKCYLIRHRICLNDVMVSFLLFLLEAFIHNLNYFFLIRNYFQHSEKDFNYIFVMSTIYFIKVKFFIKYFS